MVKRLIVVLAGMQVGTAQPQPLADPTRPPAAGAADSVQAEPAQSRLQSVLISPSRRVAVIDGRTVSLGERVGAGRLVSVDASEVTLQQNGERQTLKLLPAGVDKKPVKK